MGISIFRRAGFELYVFDRLVIIPPLLPPENRNGFLPIIPASKLAVAPPPPPPTGAPIVPAAGRVVPPWGPIVPDIPIEPLIPPAVFEEVGTCFAIDYTYLVYFRYFWVFLAFYLSLRISSAFKPFLMASLLIRPWIRLISLTCKFICFWRTSSYFSIRIFMLFLWF